MIKSMTGFGRCEIADEKRKFTVELKSVNHRYLDVNMKMPKKLNFFESAIRSLLKKYIERGKVDLYISYEDYTEDNYALKYNEGLAGEYLKYLNAMAETFHLENDVPPNLKYPSMNQTANQLFSGHTSYLNKQSQGILLPLDIPAYDF